MQQDDDIKYRYGKPMDMTAFKRTISWRHDMQVQEKSAATKAAAHIRGIRSDCPICLCNQSDHYATIYGFDYMICSDCEHLYYRQIVNPEAIQENYDGDTGYLSTYFDEDLHRKKTEMVAKPKIEHISQNISWHPGDEWLDLGCGGCNILIAAKDFGWSVRGVEPCISGVRYGQAHGIEVTRSFCTPENVAALVGEAKVISLFNVLEHVVDPVALIASIARNMKSGAYLVCEVPRHPSLSSVCCKLHPESVSRYIVPPQHLHIFSEKSMQKLLEKTEMSLSSVWRFGQDFYETMSLLTELGGNEIDVWPKELMVSFCDVQFILDKHGLSDCLLIIANKISFSEI